MTTSIRRRLFVGLLVPLCVLFVVTVAFAYRVAYDTARSAFDHALTDDTLALASRVSVRPDGTLGFDLPPAAEAIIRTDSEDIEFLSVWGPDGRLLVGDADLPPAPDAPSDHPRLSDSTIRGLAVRKSDFRLATPAGTIVAVFAETHVKRREAQARILASLIVPNVVLVVLAFGLVWLGVSRALSPLTRLSTAIARRSAEDVSPLGTEGVDREVLPLVQAIDRLMGDLAAAAVAQRRFLSNAAHQLRTPLAGLQTQIELAAADLPPENRGRVAALAVAARSVGHLSQQLLAHARSAPEAAIGHDLERVDLAELVEARASHWYDDGLGRGADIGFEIAPAQVTGSPWLIGEMLANLVDNALKHGGSTITVRCGTTPAGAPFVEVEDDGPGIPEAERGRVFERFYRGRDTTGPGTGLGLAIVHEVAERHGARATIGAGAGGKGVRVGVVFPAVAPENGHHPGKPSPAEG